MKEYIERFLERHFQTDWKSCTDEQLYQALLSMTQEKTQQLPKRDEKGRKLYYLSAEFLVGRLLGNNLLNLGLYEQVDNLLQSQGRSLAAIEELEAEPSLGNGGLGRLAACFLDSIAPWDCMERASDWRTTLGCFVSGLSKISRRSTRTAGESPAIGCAAPMYAIRCRLGSSR